MSLHVSTQRQGPLQAILHFKLFEKIDLESFNTSTKNLLLNLDETEFFPPHYLQFVFWSVNIQNRELQNRK